jgi:hypothetical protein
MARKILPSNFGIINIATKMAIIIKYPPPKALPVFVIAMI